MGLIILKGIGYLMITGSATAMFKILNKSVVIEKRKFRDIEKRIREDERQKIHEEKVYKGEVLCLKDKN